LRVVLQLRERAMAAVSRPAAQVRAVALQQPALALEVLREQQEAAEFEPLRPALAQHDQSLSRLYGLALSDWSAAAQQL
jgi:hypothetical protein